jgi:hypothetical protein
MAIAARAAKGALAGRVAEIAYFGDRTRYVVRTEAGKRLLISRAGGGPPLALSVGDAAWVSYPADAAVRLPR